MKIGLWLGYFSDILEISENRGQGMVHVRPHQTPPKRPEALGHGRDEMIAAYRNYRFPADGRKQGSTQTSKQADLCPSINYIMTRQIIRLSCNTPR